MSHAEENMRPSASEIEAVRSPVIPKGLFAQVADSTSLQGETLSRRIAITAMGKPRMTQSDKWKKRPVVERYWDYCDRIREAFGVTRYNLFKSAKELYLAVYFSTYDKALWGTHHDATPDIDNQIKSVLDALIKEDKYVARIVAEKFWSDLDVVEITLTGVER